MSQVTIITASYNHAQHISFTIESVLNQSFTDFKYIILDDGSKDNSLDIIHSYAEKDKRILVLSHENKANKGLPATITACIHEINTPYIAFIESDDIWEKDFLKIMVDNAEKHKEIDLFYCDVKPFGEHEYMNAKHISMLNKRGAFARKKYIDKAFLLFNYPISTFSSVFCKSELLKNCSFNPQIPNALDKYLWAQCLTKVKSCFIDKKLTLWRKHQESYSILAPDTAKLHTIDMLFHILYPQGTQKDTNFYHALLKGKIEKIFRPQVHSIIYIYIWLKYGFEKVQLIHKQV